MALELIVESDIKSDQRRDRTALNLFFISPKFIGRDQLTELRSPITDIIPADHLIAKRLVDISHSIAEYRSAQMTDMHGFGNIGLGIFDNNGFTRAQFGSTEGFAGFINLSKLFSQIVRRQKKINITPNGFNSFDF